MITLTATDLQVAKKLPPAKGPYIGWDWRTFYNAILHVMQNPTSQAAHYNAYHLIAALPPTMRMTPQVLTAGWARFTQLFPGWRTWDYRAAYDTMYSMLDQAGRLVKGDERQWWTVEQAWQEMEVQNVRFIARPASRISASGVRM